MLRKIKADNIMLTPVEREWSGEWIKAFIRLTTIFHEVPDKMAGDEQYRNNHIN